MIRLILPLAFLLMLGSSCTKTEGEGGTSTITGKVKVMDYNNSGQLQGEYYGQEERVYIVYGDNAVYDDWMRTGHDGSYKFEFLNQGDYSIYAYSDCAACDSGSEPIFEFAVVSSNKTEITVPDIVVIR